MKISRVALSAMIASACLGGTVFGQSNRTAPRYYPASYYSYHQDGDKTQAPAPVTSASDAPKAVAPVAAAPAPVSTSCGCSVEPSCGCATEPTCGCAMEPTCGCAMEPTCGCAMEPACEVAAICDGKMSCDTFGCDSPCGAAAAEPWKLFPNGIAGINVGGWTSVGYHDRSTLGNFNNYDGHVQLGQQWFFAEKIADGSEGLGVGGRIDYLYGTDSQDTQAFGIDGHWDTGWDNGVAYGRAMPQLYGEVAMGDLSVKVGKMFTIVGNEVVQSTGNFFYSRQFTFYNAEPFTHTGALTTYNVDEDTQLYNGYVMGWDSGFDDNGDAYMGGFKRKLNDKLSVLYTSVLGRMGDGVVGIQERGNVHNLILTATLSDKLTFINQTDVLYTKNVTGAQHRNTFGNISYLIYQVSDKVSLGQRFEWFNFGGAGFGGVKNDDLSNYTLGVNFKPHSNLTLRPEVRWIWDNKRFGFNENFATSQVSAGGDVVFTF